MATDALSGVYEDRLAQMGTEEKLGRLTAATDWSVNNSQIKRGTVYPARCDGTFRGHILLWVGSKDLGFVRIDGIDEALYRGQDGLLYRKVHKRQFVRVELDSLDQVTQDQLYSAISMALARTAY